MDSKGSRGPQRRSELTRQRIRDAAKRLFNERGTSGVTTNHIAADAGLSPGDLYYHFGDKQEIIRSLFAEYAAAHAALWQVSADARENLAGLGRNMVAVLDLSWQYRFFEREILGLARGDAELRAQYREAYERRLGQWVSLGNQLADQGVLRRQASPTVVRELALCIWLIGQSWVAFLDVTGDGSDRDQVAGGAELILTVLGPYLTAKGRRALGTSDVPARAAQASAGQDEEAGPDPAPARTSRARRGQVSRGNRGAGSQPGGIDDE